MFLLDKFTTTYTVNSVGPWFDPRSRSHKWQAKSSTWDKSSVLFSCPKSLHTNFRPVALILLRLYALLKHEKNSPVSTKKLTPQLTSVCSSAKENEATFGNVVSALMAVTSVSPLAPVQTKRGETLGNTCQQPELGSDVQADDRRNCSSAYRMGDQSFTGRRRQCSTFLRVHSFVSGSTHHPLSGCRG